MSQHRIRPDRGWVYSTKERGPNGRGICRHCGQEVAKGRRTFCSEDCVHDFKMQSNPGYVRQQVSRRDRGICSACGLDTDALRQEVGKDRWYRTEVIRQRLASLGFDKMALYPGDFWQADHLVPVAEGGGGCGLDGYRTLCTPCHRKATSELRVRLAAKRRLEKLAARDDDRPLLRNDEP